MARELVRQAFLLAARDECGLATRDATIREEIVGTTPNPRSAAFEMYCDFERPEGTYKLHYILSRTGPKGTEKLWEWTKEVPRFELMPVMSEEAESLSRGRFKELLTGYGWANPVHAARRSSVVPREASEAIWEYNELAVLGGLQRLHAEVRDGG